MFENEWLLGKELQRLFENGTMGHGGDRKTKPKNFGLTYADFGLSDMHGGLIREVARTMDQAELLEWVRGKCNEDKRALPRRRENVRK